MKFNRRLLELSGIIHRSEKLIITEGDDESGDDSGDDLFGDDSDDDGGDDPFGGDDGGDEEEGGEEAVREPPESLDAQDVEEFGSPRFKEFDAFLANAFQESQASAFVGAQESEAYPGETLPTTPAKDEEPEESDEDAESDGDEDKEANESLLSRRDKALIVEAIFLLTEAGENEPAPPDEFDMEHFARQVQHLIQHHDTITDIEGSIFNMARQMILNNFGAETENEFIEFLARLDPEMDFTGQFQEDIQAPPAVGAVPGGGAA